MIGPGLSALLSTKGKAEKYAKAKKKILFVSCNGLKKNRVGMSVKSFIFFA